MLNFYQIFLIVFCVLLTSFNSVAEQKPTSSIKEQIVAIEQEEDKKLVLSSLQSLLNSYNLNNQERLQILESIESHYRNSSNFINAIETVERIILLSAQNRSSLFIGNAYKRLGIYHYLNGDLDKALKQYLHALEFFNPLVEPIQTANLFNNIGLVQVALGYNNQAISSYKKAERLYQEYGSEKDKIDIRFNIAGLYLKLDRYDSAIEAYLTVIERREGISDHVGVADAYSDLGIAYKQSGNPEVALDYMNKSLRFFQQNNNLFKLAGIYHNISEVYFELNQFDKSLDFSDQSIQISDQNGYKTVLAGALHTYAKSLYFNGSTNLSLDYLIRSQTLSKELNYAKQIEFNLSLFALVYASLNKTEQALKYHHSYLLSRNKRENDSFNMLLAEYESEQLKQQVIQLKQNEKLQQLDHDKAVQERNFLIVATVLILLIAFFIYRRNTERKSKLALITQVKQRTHELELLTEKLQSANKVKSLFLANMSHEIRTPLTAIIAQSESLLLDEINMESLESDIHIIHNNSLHLLELINNILDLSKVEANKLDLDIQIQDLHFILQDVVNMFSEQANSKGLSFQISHTLPTPFLIPIDSFRVKQILINLCSNAVKFTSQGYVKIDVSLQDNQLTFAVEDTGIGLSSSQVNNVFESFTQGDSSISRRFGGTGLGLCLSQQLALLMDGKIEISSILNQGSTFSLVIPCAEEDTNDVEQKVHFINSSAESDDLKEEKNKLSGTILLAEDHQDNCKLISRLLSSLGLIVFTAKNGKEAVEQYIKHNPDVILLDIQMPEMDGIEAHSIMRQKGATQPIIALTANAMSHEVEEYLAQGFDDHLKKPIERKAFIKTISHYYHDDFCSDKAEDSLKNVDMSDLIEQFKSNLVLEQQDIILHIKNEDFEKLSQLVHRLAGAAQMFGFNALTEHAIKLEKVIKNNEFNYVSNNSQALLNEIDKILW